VCRNDFSIRFVSEQANSGLLNPLEDLMNIGAYMMQRTQMTRRNFLHSMGLAAGLPVLSCGKKSMPTKTLPNFVIILADDQGYADVGCFGAEGFKTPHLDQMAAEGIRFTDFYVGQSVCGPSRAALLTGCYPNRIGMAENTAPGYTTFGLSRNEMTIADLVKQRGYSTAIYGKWHQGHQAPFLPTHHGFDEYFGLPYSNDMWPNHPERDKFHFPPLPLMEGEKILAYDPDQSQLTTWYTERAVRFIEKSQDRPFLLYVAHNMPHVPLYVSDKFKGQSQRGLYGDVIMELDWSVGQILATLKRTGLDENTWVLFVSDNGPWLSYGEHAGSAKPLREGKSTSWDGGSRTPAIMRWPGKIPAGVICHEPLMTIDLLPTIAHLSQTELPSHKIDGMNIWPVISGAPHVASPHEALYFYREEKLEAVRSGKWKLHFPHTYSTLGGKPGGRGGYPAAYETAMTELALFDLDKDVGEQNSVAAENPDVVQRLTDLAQRFDRELQANKRAADRL
jgi:arylsulfatase A